MTRRSGLWRGATIAAAVGAIAAAIMVWRMPELAAWRWYARSGKPAMYAGAIELAPSLRWFDDYYVVADLGDHAYAIGEPRYGQCNFSYLIVGSNVALLFDTGPGVRDIRPVVRSLTDRPVEALPSHLHFDHTGNLGRFERVDLPDLPALRRQTHEGRFALGFYQFLGFVEGFSRPSFAVTRWITPESDIDLGGRRLTLMSVPGHTPDSVVLWDRDGQRLFAGDFIYPSEIYAFLPGANLGDYAASTRRVAERLDDRSAVYGAHGCDRLPAVAVPLLRKQDVVDLGHALTGAERSWTRGAGWYPRELPVNEGMTLLAKYPWMRP
jgi:hydroxyacylglutathione hydrolase